MSDLIPEQGLGPQNQRWRRWVERTITSLLRSLQAVRSEMANSFKAVASSMRLLSEQVRTVIAQQLQLEGQQVELSNQQSQLSDQQSDLSDQQDLLEAQALVLAGQQTFLAGLKTVAGTIGGASLGSPATGLTYLPYDPAIDSTVTVDVTTGSVLVTVSGWMYGSVQPVSISTYSYVGNWVGFDLGGGSMYGTTGLGVEVYSEVNSPGASSNAIRASYQYPVSGLSLGPRTFRTRRVTELGGAPVSNASAGWDDIQITVQVIP